MFVFLLVACEERNRMSKQNDKNKSDKNVPGFQDNLCEYVIVLCLYGGFKFTNLPIYKNIVKNPIQCFLIDSNMNFTDYQVLFTFSFLKYFILVYFVEIIMVWFRINVLHFCLTFLLHVLHQTF